MEKWAGAPHCFIPHHTGGTADTNLRRPPSHTAQPGDTHARATRTHTHAHMQFTHTRLYTHTHCYTHLPLHCLHALGEHKTLHSLTVPSRHHLHYCAPRACRTRTLRPRAHRAYPRAPHARPHARRAPFPHRARACAALRAHAAARTPLPPHRALPARAPLLCTSPTAPLYPHNATFLHAPPSRAACRLPATTWFDITPATDLSLNATFTVRATGCPCCPHTTRTWFRFIPPPARRFVVCRFAGSSCRLLAAHRYFICALRCR